MKTIIKDRIKGYAALLLCVCLIAAPQFTLQAQAGLVLHIWWVGPISVAWWWIE